MPGTTARLASRQRMDFSSAGRHCRQTRSIGRVHPLSAKSAVIPMHAQLYRLEKYTGRVESLECCLTPFANSLLISLANSAEKGLRFRYVINTITSRPVFS